MLWKYCTIHPTLQSTHAKICLTRRVKGPCSSSFQSYYDFSSVSFPEQAAGSAALHLPPHSAAEKKKVVEIETKRWGTETCLWLRLSTSNSSSSALAKRFVRFILFHRGCGTEAQLKEITWPSSTQMEDKGNKTTYSSRGLYIILDACLSVEHGFCQRNHFWCKSMQQMGN